MLDQGLDRFELIFIVALFCGMKHAGSFELFC